MSRRPRLGHVAVTLTLLLAAATVGGGVSVVAGQAVGGPTTATDASPSATPTAASTVGPASVGPEADANRTGVGPITRCFNGDGYSISIGDGEGGATMATVIHLSVLTDPAAGNEFGIETAGRLDGESIVTLAAGVRLTGREAIANGFDPFAAFDVLYTYDLRLPMFDGSIGDAGYEDAGSPIGSKAGAVAC